LAEGFTEDEIVVLSPKSNTKSCAGLLKDRQWASKLLPFEYKQSGKIRYSSIHAFKGLEASVIVLSDVDNLGGLEPRQLFYVAASRAFHRLIIIAANSVQKELNKMLSGQRKAPAGVA